MGSGCGHMCTHSAHVNTQSDSLPCSSSGSIFFGPRTERPWGFKADKLCFLKPKVMPKGGTRQVMFMMGHCNTINMSKRLKHNSSLSVTTGSTAGILQKASQRQNQGDKKHWECNMSLGSWTSSIYWESKVLLLCLQPDIRIKRETSKEMQVRLAALPNLLPSPPNSPLLFPPEALQEESSAILFSLRRTIISSSTHPSKELILPWHCHIILLSPSS